MDDAPPPLPRDDDRDGGRRRSRGGRGRRGGRGGGGYGEAGPPPPLPPVTEPQYDAADALRRRPVPRDQLLNPRPIPGRLRSDAEGGIDSLMSEIQRNGPPAGAYSEAAPPPRERGGRGDGDRRGGRSDRGGRGERPPRESSEPRAAGSAAPFLPAREATMTNSSTLSPSAERAAPADEFGAGLFDEPVVKPVARAVPAAQKPAAPAAAPKAAPKPAEDDGFGEGLL